MHKVTWFPNHQVMNKHKRSIVDWKAPSKKKASLINCSPLIDSARINQCHIGKSKDSSFLVSKIIITISQLQKIMPIRIPLNSLILSSKQQKNQKKTSMRNKPTIKKQIITTQSHQRKSNSQITPKAQKQLAFKLFHKNIMRSNIKAPKKMEILKVCQKLSIPNMLRANSVPGNDSKIIVKFKKYEQHIN